MPVVYLSHDLPAVFELVQGHIIGVNVRAVLEDLDARDGGISRYIDEREFMCRFMLGRFRIFFFPLLDSLDPILYRPRSYVAVFIDKHGERWVKSLPDRLDIAVDMDPLDI